MQYVHSGEDVVVQTDAYPDSFHGRISYVSPALDPNTRTLQARIVVDNPGEKLKRDMYCTVTVTAGVACECARGTQLRRFCATTTTSRSSMSLDWRKTSLAGATWSWARARMARRKFVKGISAGDKVVGDGSLFLQFANSLQH